MRNRSATPGDGKNGVWNDDGSTCPSTGFRRIAMQLAHDELQEEQRRLCRLLIFGEITLNPLLFLTAKRWVREDYVDPVLLSDFR